jgi:hypothetical protein
MSRKWGVFPIVVVVTVVGVAAQHEPGSAGKPGKTRMTDAQKIASAMSAAPGEIAKGATIMDWPEGTSKEMRQLRAGTNGWVCYPSSPAQSERTQFEDPMCLDKAWQGWAEAWMNKTPPSGKGAGIAYMLKGDKGASNTDPHATGPTPDNQWVVTAPHVMVLFEDTKILDSFPTDPTTGGPYVMWKGTPYAHLMVPVAPGTHLGGKSSKAPPKK